ncbi:hypothetical protein DQ04_15121010 [Trypanosoma grayi]|uniref:hypothetical protein n=1 Tax=Trypanosoma grayi TaxID=71804 RepID=UPI0004F46E3E|nr:hypothetical protein DQ04_15121010 [Trypanosoma grayi]KEG06230.1 hypothetical protein DQ04_15121010 [Trypanosoma grayi]
MRCGVAGRTASRYTTPTAQRDAIRQAPQTGDICPNAPICINLLRICDVPSCFLLDVVALFCFQCPTVRHPGLLPPHDVCASCMYALAAMCTRAVLVHPSVRLSSSCADLCAAFYIDGDDGAAPAAPACTRAVLHVLVRGGWGPEAFLADAQ